MRISKMFLVVIATILMMAMLTGCTTTTVEEPKTLVTVTVEGDDISISKDGVDLDLIRDVIFE